MVQFFSKRRLKIAEQIIIVIFFAVLIPMTVSGIIISNINQQSNRAQLRSAATMVANIVSEEVDVFEHSINNELAQIITTLEYYKSPEQEQKYLDSLLKDAISRQLVSDMPICTFLSGGLDSSIITKFTSDYMQEQDMAPLDT